MGLLALSLVNVISHSSSSVVRAVAASLSSNLQSNSSTAARGGLFPKGLIAMDSAPGADIIITVMTQVTEAIFTHGVLKPIGHLDLAEQERVRLIVEPINRADPVDRQAAIDRLLAGIQQMHFRLKGPLPSRDELHDRT
jgi:predicted DNA-binding antitoxin AbrB/MazE fold protein